MCLRRIGECARKGEGTPIFSLFNGIDSQADSVVHSTTQGINRLIKMINIWVASV